MKRNNRLENLKGRIYFQFLTKEEQENLKNNMTAFWYDMIMRNTCKNFYTFIYESFVWADTPEGIQYWKKIAESIK